MSELTILCCSRKEQQPPTIFVTIRFILSFSVCILFLAGCGLPNVKPFAEGVAKVHRGIDRSGIVFRDEAIRLLGKDHQDVATFIEHWQKRRQATEALVRYADALADVVESANNIQQNVDAFGSAVDDLGRSIGQVGLAGSAAFQAGGQFYELGVKVAAHRTLSKAVSDTQESIFHICHKILVKDLTQMRGSLLTVEQTILVSFETDEIDDETNRLTELKARRAKLYKELTKDWAKNHKTHLNQLNDIDKLIGTIQKRIDENNRKKHDEVQAFQTRIELLDRTVEAVKLVAAAHQELGRALEEGRQLSTRNLLAAAMEISRTIDAIENIKEESHD